MLADRLLEKTQETTRPLRSKPPLRHQTRRTKNLTPHARLVKSAQELFPGSEILGHFPAG